MLFGFVAFPMEHNPLFVKVKVHNAFKMIFLLVSHVYGGGKLKRIEHMNVGHVPVSDRWFY